MIGFDLRKPLNPLTADAILLLCITWDSSSGMPPRHAGSGLQEAAAIIGLGIGR
jgi:hypothetical protein